MNNNNMTSKQPVICMKCETTFGKLSNLRAHVLRKHPDDLNTLAPKKQYNQVATCDMCSVSFAHMKSLKWHFKKKHPEKLETLSKKSYQCLQCNESFNTLLTFSTHKKTHKVLKLISCSVCEFKSTSEKTIIEHFENVHQIDVKTECFSFDLVENFETWKETLEIETQSKFVNLHGFYNTKSYKRIQYYCHRSGYYKSNSKNVKKFKFQGSEKINGFCPAKIDCMIVNGKYNVKLTSTHVGHSGELALSMPDRQQIAQNVPIRTILDEVQQSGTKDKLKRIHLLEKKDIYNIKRDFGLIADQESVYNGNDNIKYCILDLEEEKLKLMNEITEIICSITSFEDFDKVSELILNAKNVLYK